ncbi:related to Histone acetyltransferase RTT109 [Hanseniaspora guilliermondii]|uniref:histone acetyltransferase n=1 Tax=Hanseniaspora guilliermondii TaxID=56406 RepID=A0A1L0CIR5_9ASCO|nr:related to Histone acetyltransferase RTT109 [Hanseniaspora guilliermondii]
MVSLINLIKEALPNGEKFEVYHLIGPTREIKGFKVRKHNNCDLITKTSHFFTLSHGKKVFFAIDINIYLEVSVDKIERTVFVSKADTNGYIDIESIKISSIVQAILKFICRISPMYYLGKVIPLNRNYEKIHSSNIITKKTKTKHALRELSKRAILRDQRVTIPSDIYKKICVNDGYQLITSVSMFTRPEPHYLFTDSGNNPKKHFLPGDKLLKWWLHIVDMVFTDDALFEQNNILQGVLKIPGEDVGFITNRYIKQLVGNWSVGFLYGSQNESLHKIPFFNDDPKTRFLRDLITEDKYDNYNIKKFWMDMEGRQEFRAGVVVGVIGFKGLSKNSSLCTDIYDDSFIHCSSKQSFKKYKSYVVGEEYATEEGAKDSRDNLHHLWLMQKKNNFSVIGISKQKNRAISRQSPEVNTLSIRKKTQ